MKKPSIWLCIISLLFLHKLSAQSTDAEIDSLALRKEKKRKKPVTLRAGTDLYHLGRSQVDTDFSGMEWVVDLNLTNNLYVALEFGSEQRTIQSEQINFSPKGSYLKAGIDYNMYANWKGMDNQVYIGFRLGSSAFETNINNYILYTTQHFFEQSPISSSYATGLKADLTAQWFEAVAGVKAALFKNVYLGFSLRLNVLINESKTADFDNLYIPGFNKVTDENIFGIGFNYTLTYALPFRFEKKTKTP